MPTSKTATPKKTQDLTVVDSIPLQGAGKTFSDREITDGFNRADQAKKNFQIECIRTGLMLQVKKSELKHGQFKPYIDKLQKGNAFPFSVSYDSAKLYMKVAEYFSKWFTDGSKAIEVSSEGVFSLLSSSNKDRKAAFKVADEFVNGRSLRRMLKDFRQAEKAAAEEGKPKKKPDKRSPDQIRADAREAICEEIAGHINSLKDTLKRPAYMIHLKVEDFEEFGDHIKWVGNEFLKLVARDKRK